MPDQGWVPGIGLGISDSGIWDSKVGFWVSGVGFRNSGSPVRFQSWGSEGELSCGQAVCCGASLPARQKYPGLHGPLTLPSAGSPVPLISLISCFVFRVLVFRFPSCWLGILVSSLGFGVSGFGFRVSRFEFRVSGFGFGVNDYRSSSPQCTASLGKTPPGSSSWFRVSGFGFRVSDFRFRVSGFGFRNYLSGWGSGLTPQSKSPRTRPAQRPDSGFRVFQIPMFQGFRFRVSGFRFRVSGSLAVEN